MAKQAKTADQPPQRRRRIDPRRDRRRQQLLSIALDAFTAKSYEAVSVDDIAAEAGVSHGLIFHHFGNKRGLYLAALHSFRDRLLTLAALEESLGPRAQVETVVLAYVRFVETHAERMQLLLTAPEKDVHDLLEADRHETARRLFVSVSGKRTPTQMQLTAVRAWMGFLEAGVLDWLANGKSTDEAQFVELVTDCFEFLVGATGGSVRDSGR